MHSVNGSLNLTSHWWCPSLRKCRCWRNSSLWLSLLLCTYCNIRTLVRNFDLFNIMLLLRCLSEFTVLLQYVLTWVCWLLGECIRCTLFPTPFPRPFQTPRQDETRNASQRILDGKWRHFFVKSLLLHVLSHDLGKQKNVSMRVLGCCCCCCCSSNSWLLT